MRNPLRNYYHCYFLGAILLPEEPLPPLAWRLGLLAVLLLAFCDIFFLLNIINTTKPIPATPSTIKIMPITKSHSPFPTYLPSLKSLKLPPLEFSLLGDLLLRSAFCELSSASA